MVPSNWKAPGDTVLLSQATVIFAHEAERAGGLLEVLLFLKRGGRLLPARHVPGEFVYQISSQKNPIFSCCCQQAAISVSSPVAPLYAHTTGSEEQYMDVGPYIDIYMLCQLQVWPKGAPGSGSSLELPLLVSSRNKSQP